MGWWFGLGLFGAGVPWVYISVHEFGSAWAPVKPMPWTAPACSVVPARIPVA
jgi:apolipoprotein N-acyltransferase